jgi:hypothetical protein
VFLQKTPAVPGEHVAHLQKLGALPPEASDRWYSSGG